MIYLNSRILPNTLTDIPKYDITFFSQQSGTKADFQYTNDKHTSELYLST